MRTYGNRVLTARNCAPAKICAKRTHLLVPHFIMRKYFEYTRFEYMRNIRSASRSLHNHFVTQSNHPSEYIKRMMKTCVFATSFIRTHLYIFRGYYSIYLISMVCALWTRIQLLLKLLLLLLLADAAAAVLATTVSPLDSVLDEVAADADADAADEDDDDDDD